MPTPHHAGLRHLSPSRAISRHLAPSRGRCTGCFGRSTRWRGRRGKPRTARAERPRRPTGRWPTRWSAPTRSSTSSPWSASSRRIRRPLPRSARPHDVTSHEPRGPPVWRCFSPLIEFLVDCSFLWSTHGMAMGLQWVERETAVDRRPDHVRATPRAARTARYVWARGRGDLRSLFRGAHVRSTVPCAGHALHDGSAHTHVKGLYTRLSHVTTCVAHFESSIESVENNPRRTRRENYNTRPTRNAESHI